MKKKSQTHTHTPNSCFSRIKVTQVARIFNGNQNRSESPPPPPFPIGRRWRPIRFHLATALPTGLDFVWSMRLRAISKLLSGISRVRGGGNFEGKLEGFWISSQVESHWSTPFHLGAGSRTNQWPPSSSRSLFLFQNRNPGPKCPMNSTHGNS